MRQLGGDLVGELAVTAVPVLCSLLVRGPFHAEKDNIIMRFLLRLYDPALNWALNHRRTIIGIAMMILASALTIASTTHNSVAGDYSFTAPAIADEFLRHPVTRRSLAAQADPSFQMMVGYSDSNKDGGYLCSQWSLSAAQAALTATLASAS